MNDLTAGNEMSFRIKMNEATSINFFNAFNIYIDIFSLLLLLWFIIAIRSNPPLDIHSSDAEDTVARCEHHAAHDFD